MEAVVEEASCFEQSIMSVSNANISQSAKTNIKSADFQTSQIFLYNPEGEEHFATVEGEASDGDGEG